jgi:hypothetical protein
MFPAVLVKAHFTLESMFEAHISRARETRYESARVAYFLTFFTSTEHLKTNPLKNEGSANQFSFSNLPLRSNVGCGNCAKLLQLRVCGMRQTSGGRKASRGANHCFSMWVGCQPNALHSSHVSQ